MTFEAIRASAGSPYLLLMSPGWGIARHHLGRPAGPLDDDGHGAC